MNINVRPGDIVPGGMVIASSYAEHEDEEYTIVIILRDIPPYFSIAYIWRLLDVPEIVDQQYNIVGAAKSYVDHNGDPGDYEGAFLN